MALAFLQSPPNRSEEAHTAGRRAREVIIHSLFAIESAWGQSLAASVPRNPPKTEERGQNVGGPWKAARTLTARLGILGGPSKSCTICSSLLAGGPEKPRVKTQARKASPPLSLKGRESGSRRFGNTATVTWPVAGTEQPWGL